MSILIILFLAYGTFWSQQLRIVNANKNPSDCEIHAPIGFSKVQKVSLCCNHTVKGDIGPATCAVTAKEILRGGLSIDEAISLCTRAISASPAKCMHSLEFSFRKSIGIKLCREASSSLPGECFSYLEKNKNKDNKLTTEVIADFCIRIGDNDSPLNCIKHIIQEKWQPTSKAMEMCTSAVGGNNSASYCMKDMKKYINSVHGLRSSDIISFCISAIPETHAYHRRSSEFEILSHSSHHNPDNLISSLSKCYFAASDLKTSPSSSTLFNSKQKLKLCENAPPFNNGHGPVNCTRILTQNSFDTKLRIDDIIDLCSGSLNEGPASCFLESKGLGSNEKRIDLCSGATGAGPAHCYRKTQNLFKSDEASQKLLCVGVDSDAPAQCFVAAPLYLTMEEKIHLCSNAPVSRGDEPVKCVQAIESPSKLFHNSPIKGLGQFLSATKPKESDRFSRELLVNMCSFSASSWPLASAECLKSAPKSLLHDDAARICTNISSAEVMVNMQLCSKLLPREWTDLETALLCGKTSDRKHTERVIKCGMDLFALAKSSPVLKLTRNETAGICSNEDTKGQVLDCAKAALQISSSKSTLTYHSLFSVCTVAKSVDAGTCLNKITSTSESNKISIENSNLNLADFVCGLSNPLSKLRCLLSKSRHIVSIEDVQQCDTVQRIPSSVKVIKFFTEDNDVVAITGRSFAVWVKVYDQWGDVFDSSFSAAKSKAEKEYARQQQGGSIGVLFFATINENNPQGAVLWGIKSNESNAQGILQFNKLAISQPGQVEFKIYFYKDSNTFESRERVMYSLGIFSLDVKEDPNAFQTVNCVYLFHNNICPRNTFEWNYNADFPRMRSVLTVDARTYLQSVSFCSDIWRMWHIDVWIMSDASVWLEYKVGIDSIWTGVGLPSEVMSYEDRLELPDKVLPGAKRSEEGVFVVGSEDPSHKAHKSSKQANKKALDKKAVLKNIRRAYYRKSLQWHPDRWAGMSSYHIAVQGAFELVHEAYEALNRRVNGED